MTAVCEVTLNIFSGNTISVIMKKWHSGVESQDILNPALYSQHHMKTRWSSNSLVQRGRSGALSVTLSAALRVRGKPLNEVSEPVLQSQSKVKNRFAFVFVPDIPLPVLPTRVLRIFKRPGGVRLLSLVGN